MYKVKVSYSTNYESHTIGLLSLQIEKYETNICFSPFGLLQSAARRYVCKIVHVYSIYQQLDLTGLVSLIEKDIFRLSPKCTKNQNAFFLLARLMEKNWHLLEIKKCLANFKAIARCILVIVDILQNYVLCISTSEQVLRMPFAGRNRLSYAKTTFSVTNGTK